MRPLKLVLRISPLLNTEPCPIMFALVKSGIQLGLFAPSSGKGWLVRDRALVRLERSTGHLGVCWGILLVLHLPVLKPFFGAVKVE